jgi:predicted N-acyltransferase
VFDFAWASAYQRAGHAYYPKLVCASPFTPVPGPRLLTPDAAQSIVDAAAQARCSGAHVLFALPDETAALVDAGWLRRDDLRYVWNNRGYADFDAFLAALAGKRRKNIVAERRRLQEAGLHIEWREAGAIEDAEWPLLFDLYASTYALRGQEPYLNLDCLRRWAQAFPKEFLFCIARRDARPIALAFFFRDEAALYGRHWGASEQVDGLHFELCYYQGIDYCIAHRLAHFDAGVQGEHKPARGFDAVASHSLHWLRDPAFRAAVARYLVEERAHVAERIAGSRSAYR